MQLTQDQKTKVIAWVNAGDPLAEIQRKLQSECGLALTYMDVRFLVIDLGVQVKDRPSAAPKAPAAPIEAAAADLAPEEAAEDLPGASPPGGGSVQLDLDRVTKPGCVVSGTVVFSDGVKAAWSLDQFGRLGLQASRAGYQPGPADVQAFQQELRRALERRGF